MHRRDLCGPLAGVLAVSLFAAACGSAPLAETSSGIPATAEVVIEGNNSVPTAETATTAPTTTAPTNDGAVVAVYFPNRVAFHESGTQAWFRQLEVGPTEARATVQVVNGSGRDQRFDQESLLRIGDQVFAALSIDQELSTDEVSSFDLVFPLLDKTVDGATDFDLSFNLANDGSDDSTNLRPRFDFEPTEFSDVSELAAIAQNTIVDRVATSLSGVEAHVHSVGFTDTHIGIGLTASNMRDSTRNLGGTGDDTFVTDDLGNRYALVGQSVNAQIRMEQYERLDGHLVFAGRVHPDATSLQLTINEGSDPTSPFVSSPLLEFEPIIIGGTEDSGGIWADLAPNDEQRHPNSVGATVEALNFFGPYTEVVLAVDNPRSGAVGFNSVSSTVLLDDVGNRYALAESPRNTDLKIDGERTATITLVFAGRIDPRASELTLNINDRGEEFYFDESTISPAFRFGPYARAGYQGDDHRVAVFDDTMTNMTLVPFDARTTVSD